MILKAIVPKNNLYCRYLKFWNKSAYAQNSINAVDIAFKIRKFLVAEGYENLITINHAENDYIIELNILPRIEVNLGQKDKAEIL